jgi:hypothetical protein
MPRFDLLNIPHDTMESLRLYVERRIPPGGFLLAVLSNDLMAAFSRADERNIAAMFDIVYYIYNKIPAACWGSPERVREWLQNKPQ